MFLENLFNLSKSKLHCKDGSSVVGFPKYEELSCEQKDAINLNFTSSHFVAGGPGTGKTIVALYRLHKLYEFNKESKNAIIVFNRPLVKYIKAIQKHMNWEKEFEVYTEYEWLYNVLYNGSEEKQHTNGIIKKFVPKTSEFDWEEINKDFENKKLYDNIVIDEGQDFPVGFYKLLCKVSDCLTVFGDPNQSLQKNKTNIEEIMNVIGCDVRYTLTLNYRNNRVITNFSRNYCYDRSIFAESYKVVNDYDEVSVLPLYENKEELYRAIYDIVKQYNGNDEIGIIVPSVKGTEEEKRRQSFEIYNYLKSNLSGSYKVSVYYNEEYKYQGDYNDINNVDFNERSIKIFNYLTVRGLDFDVAIILDDLTSKINEEDIDEYELIDSLNKLYVAITRTKQDLFIMPMNDKVKEVFDKYPMISNDISFPDISDISREECYEKALNSFNDDNFIEALYYAHYILAIIGAADDEVLYVNALKLFSKSCEKLGKNDFAISMLLNYKNKRGTEANKDIEDIYQNILSKKYPQLRDVNKNEKGDEKENETEKELKFDIVSKMAYLLGLNKEKYNDSKYDINIFESLERDNNAKCIRTLCEFRNICLLKAKAIVEKLKNREVSAIYVMTDVFPLYLFSNLREVNVNIADNDYKSLEQFEMAINQNIIERVGNILNLFEGINHDYIKNLFIMPNGTKYKSLKSEAEKYYTNQTLYPFGLYINWSPKNVGNVLKDDLTFCYNLYENNNDKFTDYGKTIDVSKSEKENFYNFIRNNKKVLAIVDCENTDPYVLINALNGLDDEYTSQIYKLVLVDDNNTTEYWKELEKHTNIPIEYHCEERVKEDKSLVDHYLNIRAIKEHYESNVDGILICSSDSDFFALIKELEKVDFFVFMQWEQTSDKYIEKLNEKGVNHCYIDHFYSGNGNKVKKEIFANQLQKIMNEKLNCSVSDLMSEMLKGLRMKLSDQEINEFRNRYMSNMKFFIEDDKLGVKVNR